LKRTTTAPQRLILQDVGALIARNCGVHSTPAAARNVRSRRRVLPACLTPGGKAMNWDRVEGNWKQMTGKVKEQWGKLTDDDIAQINGNREQLEGKLQAQYGYTKDQVKKNVDDWLNRS
jgi:uncharacterized protein YjbJ (UPF0337 family)